MPDGQQSPTTIGCAHLARDPLCEVLERDFVPVGPTALKSLQLRVEDLNNLNQIQLEKILKSLLQFKCSWQLAREEIPAARAYEDSSRKR